MYSLKLQARNNPQGGGNKYVQSTSNFVQDNRMSHPKDSNPQNLTLAERICYELSADCL